MKKVSNFNFKRVFNLYSLNRMELAIYEQILRDRGEDPYSHQGKDGKMHTDPVRNF